MINLQDVDNKEPIIRDFYNWLFDDNRITNKNINLKSEVDLSLARNYSDANIYFPKPIDDFFQTKAMKRLGRITQLSLLTNNHPVYHTRLEHSKGTYNRALEELIYNFQKPDWKNFIEKNNLKLYIIANLFKVAGHDIGHLPLSHALEEAIFKSHSAHEILGQRIMLENEKIHQILFSISPELPKILEELFEKDINVQQYQTVCVKTDSFGNILLADDNSIIESDNGNTFIDVYDYNSLKDIEDFLELRFSLYKNVYMSKDSKMYESAIEVFFDAFLSTDSKYGKDLHDFILELQDSDIATCDLSEFLKWDDIKLYSQIIEIAEKHEDSNISDLASMLIPNMESFLNMIYCHLDFKNTKSFSNEDLTFLKKLKYIINSDEQFSKNLRNPYFVEENTLSSTKSISLSSQLTNDLISEFSYNLRAYKKDEPIYLRDKSGKIYELSEHPERRCDWDKKNILLQSEYCYIPFLRFNGWNENEINILSNMFNPENPQSNNSQSRTLGKRTVNMQPLSIGHNIEDCFLEL